jgi:diguanylate cyclase (GGDEF)-like protein
MAVMYCDLDGFKAVNDRLGHHAGDQVLKVMGERFASCMREEDTVARVGGDEFVFVLSEVASVEHAATVARKILDAIGQWLSVEGQEVMLSGSIGIAIYPFDGDGVEHLIKSADIAMYKAKGCGKNNFQFCSQTSLAVQGGAASVRKLAS